MSIRKSGILKSLIAGILVALGIFMSTGSAQAQSSLGVRAGFRGGILHVEWDSVPQEVDGAPFGGWRITIWNPDMGILFICGPANCPSLLTTNTSMDTDLTDILTAGRFPFTIFISASVDAIYTDPKTRQDVVKYSGSGGGNFLTPPILLEEISGNGQTACTNTQLPEPFVVRLTRLGKPIAGEFLFWSIEKLPTGATTSGSSLAVTSNRTDSNGESHARFKLWSKEGEYQVKAICQVCNNTQSATSIIFTANAVKPSDDDKDGYTNCSGDCNDSDPAINPGAKEVCDSKDNNCDDNVDENDVCKAEVCDGIDNNGDGRIDEGFDSDGDGVTTCGGDCNDNDRSINPGAEEECDTKDNNCNGQVDETCNACSSNNQPLNSSVNRASGNLYDTKNLLSFSGGHLPLNFTISYNSRDTYDFPLGRGWTHAYNVQIRQDDGLSLALVDGGGRWTFYQNDGTDTYNPEPRSGLVDPIIKRGDGSYTWIKKDGTIFSFDPEGRLSTILDRNQNALILTYQENRLTQVQDPGGHTFTFTYDIADRITKITDSKGRSVSFSYSSSGDLLGIIDTTGGTWNYLYDSTGQLISKSDPSGNIITYAYDAEGRLISSADPSGIPITINYQPEENKTTVTDRDGSITTYFYDPILDKPLLIIAPDGGMTSNTYDAKGNLISTIDPAGNTTSYTYDDKGNILSITDPQGGITSYSYELLFNQVTSITDPNGNITTYSYDGLGNLLTVTDPTGGITSYSYDAQGRLIRIINSLGQTTSFTYDAAGNLISITDPTGATTTMTYDEAGNMISRTDPNGATTIFEYDPLNRLIKSIDPLGNATFFTYDARGNRISQTDAIGRTTQYEYNYQNKLTKVIDPQGGITSYAYDPKGNLLSITDANGQTTSYVYDTQNRLISETDPLGNTIRYSYDQKGNLIQKTDGNGHVISFTYDSLNRLTSKTYPDSTFESFTYDSNGRIISASNQAISYTLGYDAAGRITQSTDSRGYTVRHRYDSAGNRTSLTYPDGGSASYSYDTANRLSSMTDWNGRNITFSYDAVGQRIGLNLPNGTKTSYGYDQAGRLTDLAHKTGSGSILDSFTYTYDQIGNRLSVTMPEEKLAYTYDLLDRLIEATPTKLQGKDKEQEHKAEEFSYDTVGNRLAGPETKDTYSYNQGNQLISDRKNQYEYDRNGNMIKKTEMDDAGSTKNWTYAYDSENMLIKVTKQETGETKTVSFKYDPFGRRIEKKIEGIEAGIAETKTYSYVYDNEDIIIEYLSKTENGVSRTETTKYLHGQGIDEPLEIERKAESYYYHADGLGSIRALTDSRQKAMESYTYTSFGDLKQHGDKVKNSYTFTGREWDEEVGLYYYRARYYDAEVGRFISEDPILKPMNPITMGLSRSANLTAWLMPDLKSKPKILHPYMYVGNNPTKYLDSTGLLGWDTVIKQILKQVAKKLLKEGLGDPLEKGSEEEKRILEQIYNERYERCLGGCVPDKCCCTELECITKCIEQYRRDMEGLW